MANRFISRVVKWVADAFWHELPLFCTVFLTNYALLLCQRYMHLGGSYLFTIVYGLLECFCFVFLAYAGGKHLRSVIFAFVSIFFFFDFFLLLSYNSIIGPVSVRLALQTDLRESGEFAQVSLAMKSTWCALGFVLLLMAFSAYLGSLLRKLANKFSFLFHSAVADTVICAAVAVSLIAAMPMYRDIYKTFTSECLDDVPTVFTPYPWTRLVRAYGFLGVQASEMGVLERTVKNTVVDSCSFVSPTIVLVIGESYNKYHSPIYNPESLPTTPLLSERVRCGSMVAFDNVRSSSTGTGTSFNNMFSTRSVDMDTVEWVSRTLFPAVFKRAGYETDFYSNQFVNRDDGDVWNMVAGTLFCYGELNTLQFSHRSSGLYAYDMELLSEIDTARVCDGKPRLVIVHLLGQHFKYSLRYPPSVHPFSANDVTLPYGGDASIAADYANSIYYNDMVVDSIFRIFDNTEVVGVYLSDHGVEVYDFRDYNGRSIEEGRTEQENKYQLGVPFLFYTSELYRRRHPDIMEEINAAQHREFVTDDICHFLFRLAGISHKDYDSSRDLLSSDYYSRKK